MRVREGAGELVLTVENVDLMEALARRESMRDYFLIALMSRRGLRVGTITGSKGRTTYVRKKTGEKVTVDVNLPGIRKSDLKADGLLVHEKGHLIRTVALPKQLLEELKENTTSFKPNELLIPITRRQAFNICLKYAKLAGIENWERMHPHRLRHFFGTYMARKLGRDPWKLKSLMGHKDLRMTMIYVENLSVEEEKEVLG